MPWSTEVSPETDTVAKRFRVWKRLEKDGNEWENKVDECNVISKALGER